MKTLFKLITAAFLFCAALNTNAQTSYTLLQGKLSYSREMITACPLLTKGDASNIYLYADVGATQVNFGTITFSAETSSGVLVHGEGTLIASSSGGTLYVTSLIIGDPLGANYSFVNLNIPVSLKADNRHYRFPGRGFF